MNAALHIARKDFILYLRSSRFVLTLVLCLFLIPFTIVTGTDDYRIRQTTSENGEAIADSLLKNAFVWSQVRPLVVKKTEPLSIFCRGVTPNMGVYNQVLLETCPLLPHTYNNKEYSVMGPKQIVMQGDTGNNDNVFLNAFSYPDFTTMIGVVFSLLALVFSYDAFSHEKETGMLRMVFSCPVSRISFLFGKIGGVCMVLIPPAILCYSLSVGYLLYTGISLKAPDWSGMLLLLLLTFCYLFICTLAGIFISLVTRDATRSLTVSLLLWISMVFILPPVSGYLAETIAPIPLYRNIEAKMELLDNERFHKIREIEEKCQKEEEVEAVIVLFNHMGDDGFMDKWGITASFARAIRRAKAESEPLRIAYGERKWKLQKEYLEKLERQIRLRQRITCLSPLQIFQETSQRICHTAPESYLAYMDEVRAYRQKVTDYFAVNNLFGSYSYFTTQNENEFLTDEEIKTIYRQYDGWDEDEKRNFKKNLDNRPKLNIEGLPRFRQQTGSMREQIESCGSAFLFFIAGSLILTYITTRLSARYDIR